MATMSRATLDHKISASLSLVGPEVSGQTLTPSALNPAVKTFKSSTTPPVTLYYAAEITFSSDENIDLSSWTDTEGVTKDATGKKVQVLRVICGSSNTGNVTIAGGASNPYEMFGSSKSVEVPPGGELLMYFNDKLLDVGVTSGVTAENIKVSGTAADTCTVEMLIG